MKTITTIIFLTGAMINLEALAQENSVCGQVPVAPVLVNGSTASMDELVANSKEVKAFIELADEFLDCRERSYSRIGSRASKDRQKESIADEIRTLTGIRNDIGDRFNEQIAAYRQANPGEK